MFSQLFDETGKSAVDQAIYYEHLRGGIKKLMAKYGLQPNSTKKMSRFNVTSRKGINYRAYYDAELKEMVRKKCKWELKTFMYNFHGMLRRDPSMDISDLEFGRKML